MTEAESVDDLLFATSRQPALITHLVRRLREDPEGVYGIVAGPKEAEAIALLLAESQIPQDRVRVYHQEAALPAEAADPLAACGAPGLDRPASERWDYWTAQFARCLRCNACRESCSLCSCVRCVQEKTRPRWIDSSATPAGNWIWNVTRAFHLSGRCVGCGACEEACPVGIPLLALNRSMIAAAEKHFGPRGKEGDAIRSPLIRYETADEAPFIL
ncbi:MAG: 4Fe-4S dicluster domain-containing protein [Candidatus Eisenbacteria bacterium]|nr:4Fe-4S dicluster domain-containing protein [Candidatus Eisenbacteria bacterium]